jgi:nitrogen fixation/metabolism regulation signal transduction histidine kinase
VISIADQGGGMPFAPATNDLAPGPTTKRFGTGLGIPFALRVVDEHGGSIRFAARASHGTDVIVTIPVNENPL